MIKVSVIIINYNTFQLTCDCLKSVIDQTQDVAYEIIVVDNASTECPAAMFKDRFPAIRLIESKENIGFSKGNNLGIAQAKGEYILLLNSDTELKNNAVKIVSDFLQSHPSFGAASAKLISEDGSVQSCCQKFPGVLLRLLEFSRLHKLMSASGRAHLFYGAYFDHQTYAEPDWIWGTFFMFPKSILASLKNNQLDDSFFMYMEDMTWCYDIRKLGLNIAYLPEAVVLHHMGGSSGGKSDFMRQNYNVFLKKNYTLIEYLLLKQ